MVVNTCGNCKNESKWFDEEPCKKCWPLDGFSHWEAKEDELETTIHQEELLEL